MTIGILACPSRTVDMEQLHDWTLYQDALENHAFVGQMLGGVLRSWIENERLLNPLAIRWIYLLWERRAEILCKELTSWLKEPIALGIVPQMLSELGCQSSAMEAMKKIGSLHGEALTYRLLSQSGYAVAWIESGGDWRVDSRVVSVKTKLPLEQPFEIAAQTFRSIQAVSANRLSRNVSHVQLRRFNDLPDAQLAKVLHTMQFEIEESLRLWVDERLETGSVGESSKFAEIRSGEELLFSCLDDNQAPLAEIEFAVEKERVGLTAINHDLNAWCYEELDTDWLCRAISERLLGAASSDASEAWINVPIHPRYERFLYENAREVCLTIRRCVQNKVALPYTVCLCPEWEYLLRKPIVLAFGDSIGVALDADLIHDSSCLMSL